MNILILKDNDEFSKLTSDKIAKQHFIAYGDGPDHLRIIKDRLNAYYGAKIAAATLSWYLKSYK